MLKLKSFLLTLCFVPYLATAQTPQAPVLAAKSWLLVEMSSGQELAAQTPTERVEPASLTKLMTAYITFDALKRKTLHLDQNVLISAKAWKATGSRMFIKVDTQVRVEDLIKGMIVQSGNDASIALAEAIGGSEENFAKLMNEHAARLGMRASHFNNATGLPDTNHYSSAHDLAILASALIRDFPQEYANYYSLKEYTYNKIKQPNRNRLLWLDPSVDGMKTGFTDAAGYCLIASAKRDSRRLLSIVLGANNENGRIQESLKLINYGFQNYELVKIYAKNQAVTNLKVWKGAQSSVNVGFTNDFVLSIPTGKGQNLKTELVPQKKLTAPLQAGQVVASLKVSVDDKPFGEYPVVALDAVPQAGIFGRAFDAMRLWFN